MNLTPALVAYTGMTATQLFSALGPTTPPLVKINKDGNGVTTIPVWNVPGIAAPTSDQIAAWLAAPTPAPTVSKLLSYASTKQDAVLAQVWTFNVGTTESPLNLTTMLDDKGQASMVQLLVWALASQGTPTATEPYNNVDFTAATITVAQAQSIALQAGAVKSSAYAALNAISTAIMATPPTITTTAQVDAYTWPSP